MTVLEGFFFILLPGVLGAAVCRGLVGLGRGFGFGLRAGFGSGRLEKLPRWFFVVVRPALVFPHFLCGVGWCVVCCLRTQ